MPFNWEMDLQNAAHTYNRTPSNSKREQTVDTDSNMDEPLMHFTLREGSQIAKSIHNICYTCVRAHHSEFRKQYNYIFINNKGIIT